MTQDETGVVHLRLDLGVVCSRSSENDVTLTLILLHADVALLGVDTFKRRGVMASMKSALGVAVQIRDAAIVTGAGDGLRVQSKRC